MEKQSTTVLKPSKFGIENRKPGQILPCLHHDLQFITSGPSIFRDDKAHLYQTQADTTLNLPREV